MTEPLDAAMRDRLRAAGPTWHHDIRRSADAMLAAWQPLLEAAPPDPGPVRRDLAYGPHPRQRLDLHLPAPAPLAPGTGTGTAPGTGTGITTTSTAPGSAAAAPVLVFVHGGAFVRGEKALTPWVYANVAREFARHGHVAVNVEYRLAPEATWPAGAEDVRDAVRWVAQHAGDFGGDPARIVLMAHSAGCAHAASAAWDRRVSGPQGLPILGLVLASPRIDADQRPENPNAPGVAAYYGADPALYTERAPLHRVRAGVAPTFVGFAQYENPLLEFQALELACALGRVADAERAPMPRLAQYLDHNHVSLVAQFDTPYNAFGADVRDWIERIGRGEFARAAREAPAAA